MASVFSPPRSGTLSDTVGVFPQQNARSKQMTNSLPPRRYANLSPALCIGGESDMKKQ